MGVTVEGKAVKQGAVVAMEAVARVGGDKDSGGDRGGGEGGGLGGGAAKDAKAAVATVW